MMHSPIEPGSPTFSTASSGSDVEEINLGAPSNTGTNSAAYNLVSSSTQSSSSKRRMTPSHSLSSHRDPKSRRRDVVRMIGGNGDNERERERERQGGIRGGPGGVIWEAPKKEKEKDELLDTNLVDLLRKGTFRHLSSVHLTHFHYRDWRSIPRGLILATLITLVRIITIYLFA